MGYNVKSHRRLVMTGSVAGALASTGDGKLLFCVPCTGYVAGFIWGLDVGGTTSGVTSLMLNRVRAETDAELLSAVTSIAHDASALYKEVDTATLQNNALVVGDIVRVDLDAVTGGTDSAGLSVALILHVVRD